MYYRMLSLSKKTSCAAVFIYTAILLQKWDYMKAEATESSCMLYISFSRS